MRTKWRRMLAYEPDSRPRISGSYVLLGLAVIAVTAVLWRGEFSDWTNLSVGLALAAPRAGDLLWRRSRAVAVLLRIVGILAILVGGALVSIRSYLALGLLPGLATAGLLLGLLILVLYPEREDRTSERVSDGP